jgi:TRAP-type mannitol/chloroaromatic compound transport system substrate-binding protein
LSRDDELTKLFAQFTMPLMTRELQNRRHFLISAATGAAALASARFFSVRQLKNDDKFNGKFNIGISDWIPAALVKDAEAYYLQPIAKLFGKDLQITRVKNSDLFPDDLNGVLNPKLDAAVTSTSFHSWLYAEHACLGSLPFGLAREKKQQWLLSSEGQALQDQFFGFLGLSPQIIGIGSDKFGSFSKVKIDSEPNFRGRSIALSDLRAAWFARQRLSVRPLHPFEQASELNQGRLDISEPYPPTLSVFAIERHLDKQESWTYNLFPKIRTAPTLFCLWNKSVWSQTSVAMKGAHREIGRRGFEKISHEWIAREDQALAEIGHRHFIHEIPDSIVDLFKADADRYHNLVARRSYLANSLIRVHAAT